MNNKNKNIPLYLLFHSRIVRVLFSCLFPNEHSLHDGVTYFFSFDKSYYCCYYVPCENIRILLNNVLLLFKINKLWTRTHALLEIFFLNWDIERFWRVWLYAFFSYIQPPPIHPLFPCCLFLVKTDSLKENRQSKFYQSLTDCRNWWKLLIDH